MGSKKLYLGNNWFKDLPLSGEEKKTGKCSQYRLMHYLFSDIILANTLCENLIKSGYETGQIEELISPYNEEEDIYEDEYQYFIVKLALSEEYTVKVINEANTDLFLRYDTENDVYILSVGNLGMSREYIMTDLELTDNREEEGVINN